MQHTGEPTANANKLQAPYTHAPVLRLLRKDQFTMTRACDHGITWCRPCSSASATATGSYGSCGSDCHRVFNQRNRRRAILRRSAEFGAAWSSGAEGTALARAGFHAHYPRLADGPEAGLHLGHHPQHSPSASTRRASALPTAGQGPRRRGSVAGLGPRRHSCTAGRGPRKHTVVAGRGPRRRQRFECTAAGPRRIQHFDHHVPDACE